MRRFCSNNTDFKIDKSGKLLIKKIQSQGVLNYIYFCDEQSSIIDMEHFIRYIFFDSEHFYISDIRAIYKRRLY